MTNTVTRRDFLNGMALTIAAGLTPLEQLAATEAVTASPYPPAVTGLRGSDDKAFQVIHALAREGKQFPVDALEAEESCDLVVVGAGLAGLTAAWAYARRHPKARILILENHDDFGGHARRCEMQADGRLILGYGGSESLVAPRTKFKGGLSRVLSGIGIDPERFYDERVFHRTLYPRLGLSRGLYFDAETFGSDRLVTGDPMLLGFDEFAPKNPNARKIGEFLKDCPLEKDVRSGLAELFAGKRDYMAGMAKSEKLKRLERTSYRDFLLEICRLPRQAGDFFQGRPHDNYGLGIDAVSAKELMGNGYPGAKGLRIADAAGGHDDGSEPYIHHFPDGNATLARALVRSMIPAVAPGQKVEDLVTAHFDYGRLDEAASRVRLRLEATAVLVRNEGGGVTIGYVKSDKTHRIKASRAIVATFHVVMPHICPEIDEQRRNLMALNVRSPLLYTKVLIRNWESFVKLGVHKISAPTAFSSTVKLDYPVSFGAYKFPRRPSRPMGLQVVHVPLEQNQGLDARSQARIGRQRLLETPFSDIEGKIRSDLSRMLGKGGFDAERDILAMTVNRWSHGYAYLPNTLHDDVKAMAKDVPRLRERIGNIAFASSDTAWDAYAHAAMAEALRAVEELG